MLCVFAAELWEALPCEAAAAEVLLCAVVCEADVLWLLCVLLVVLEAEEEACAVLFCAVVLWEAVGVDALPCVLVVVLCEALL